LTFYSKEYNENIANKKSLKIFLYPVVIEPCEEGGYFAYCPVLQGCHAEGESYAEVIENIEDVIKAYISATTVK
jgi:predicted RNase H-like HicB family nuclease